MGLTGMEPGARAVAESLNIPEREVRQAVEARADTIPLDGLNWDDGDEFSQVKRVPSGGDVEEIAAGGFDSEVLNKYLGKINHRLERILRMRFGIDGHEPMTYEEIGNRYGLTRERIRQLCEEGLKSLRMLMARDGLGPGD
jgi:RNA polymerase primary sigma factor